MDYDFEKYLQIKLGNIVTELNLDVELFVSEEQSFAKMDKLKPNTIYIVIKYLSSDIQYDAETTPIQILVLSEHNGLEKAQMMMNKFANDNNWKVISENGIYIKQQYNSPVVLNNYTEVEYGYRSVLYVTGTLFIMENVVDVKNIYIDSKLVTPLSFNISYNMSTNTQQLASKYIASSVKTVSIFSLAMMIPMLESDLVTKVMKILDGTYSGMDGNDDFTITFECGLTQSVLGVIQPKPITKTMKLVSAQVTSAPNQVPSLQLGFME